MKILVCVMGQIRYSELTWANFKKYVLDELGADLATCGPDSLKLNEYTRNSILNVDSDLETGVNAERILHHRKRFYEEAPKGYDQYIITRSDHMWYGPHPKLSLDYTWFMNSEFHFGISDRHWVMNRASFQEYCESPPNFNSKCVNIEQHLFNQVKWGPGTALSPFTMYLTDEQGKTRRPDELKASRETLLWPFAFVHNELSETGMYSGRAVKTSL